MTITLDTEIRKLRPAELYTLGQILNISNSWKKLMAVVPNDTTNGLPRFNSDHFSMIEQAVYQQKRNAAEIFLDEWGTMGKQRPTLRILLDLLVKSELFRAADYVAGDILKCELPKRPNVGPAAMVDISEETINKLLNEQAVLCDTPIDNSTALLGSTLEFDISNVVCPAEVADDAVNHYVVKSDMPSVKLSNEKLTNKMTDTNLIKFSTNTFSDAEGMRSTKKLSSTQNNLINNIPLVSSNEMPGNVSSEFMYMNKEIPSQELPIFLNEVAQSTVTGNYEMKTDELPVCLNNSSFLSDTSSNENHSKIDVSLQSSCNSPNDAQTCSKTSNVWTCIEQTEVMSAELPQCAIEFGLDLCQTNSNNVTKNTLSIDNNLIQVLDSQELPIAVVEYNK